MLMNPGDWANPRPSPADAKRALQLVEVRAHFLRAYLAARGLDLPADGLALAQRLLLAMSVEAELRWVLWAVVQARASPVDFDYLEYAQQRKDAYFAYKKRATGTDA